MKTQSIIKQLGLAAIVIAGMNIYSSCDSCTRKSSDSTTIESTESTVTTYDTVGNMESADAGNQDATGITDGKTSSANIKASTANNATKTTPSSTPATNTKKSGLSEEEITNRIENSDAKSGAVDKNGNPVKSSGDAGSGMGTGTGSTGNNSRVTTRQAQKGN